MNQHVDTILIITPTLHFETAETFGRGLFGCCLLLLEFYYFSSVIYYYLFSFYGEF